MTDDQDQQSLPLSYPIKQPFGLRTAQDVAPVCGLKPERLLELARSGHAPHHVLDGGEPMFRVEEIKRWVRDNLIASSAGHSLTPALFIATVIQPKAGEAPLAIAGLENLARHQLTGGISGIYFLCDGPDVVYVGQAQVVANRIAQHMSGYMKFDRAYYVPAARSALNKLESEFIRSLKPRYNGMGIAMAKRDFGSEQRRCPSCGTLHRSYAASEECCAVNGKVE